MNKIEIRNKFIQYSTIRTIAYFYITLPSVFFTMFWLRPIIAIPSTLLLLIGLFFAIKDKDFSKERDSDLKIFNKKNLLLLFFISLIWCYLAGQGGFFYQSADHFARNAVFRDLIFYEWPVIYPDLKGMLNYYMGYWLFPACFGKIVFWITHNQHITWICARVFLLFWSTIGIMLVFTLLCKIFKVIEKKLICFLCAFFILFSGLDILGLWINNKNISLHFEWWARGIQFSSFTTCLFWVYNQTICAWIVTLLFLYEQRIQNYAYMGACLLITSPMPFVGLCPFFIVSGITQIIDAIRKKSSPIYSTEKTHKYIISVCVLLPVFIAKGIELFIKDIREKNVPDVFKKIFSFQNMIAVCVLLPIIAIYYRSNGSVQRTGSFFISPFAVLTDATKFWKYFWFYLFEFGLYAIFIFKYNRKEPLYYVTVITLLLCPFIKVGTGADFCMRGSIPSLVILMCLTYKTFITNYDSRGKVCFFLLVILCFGALTPLKEFHRAFIKVAKEHTVLLEYNTVWSINDYAGTKKKVYNVVSYKYKDSVFYKYLGRSKKK